ncbi:type IV pilus biogenesis/stability protein PilW [Pantoea sp. FN060301]|uniref:type IV pilus biogenesis/stability protein PilW n=1 Tax=Pantoea sp. FN060301 TaxID=3420380 RepID=UPI003D1675BB
MHKGIVPGLIILVLTGCGPSAQRSELAQTRLQLGLSYLALNELPAAKRNLQQAVQLAPEDYRTQLAMARYQQRAGQNESARERYRIAWDLAPQNRDVLNNYGAFLCGLRQYDAAQRQFSKAAELSGNDGRDDALENAGYCYLNAGEQQKAKVALLEATKRDPDKGKALLAEAERRFGKGEYASARLLSDVYQHNFAASAESLWLKIRFAALAQHPEALKLAGEELARNFPQSIQYLHFLANEY